MMDPITVTLLAALTAGVAGGVTKVGSELIVDAYGALKGALKARFGNDSNVAQAVDAMEKEPDFEPNQQALSGRLKQENATNDPELLNLTQKLAEALVAESKGTEVLGKYNIQAKNIGVVGDNTKIEGGLHFN
jgi:hypothetical protein